MKSYFNEETGKWNHRFRQSLLNTASICAERARLTLLEEMPYDHTDSAGMGTAVHAGIEAELSGKVGSYEQGLEVIEEAWWEEQRQPDFKWVKHSGNTAWKTIQVYWGHWYNQYDPHSRHQRGWELEHPFLYTVHEDEHRLIEMSGTYDAYDGFKLTDWKTSGRPVRRAREETVGHSAHCLLSGRVSRNRKQPAFRVCGDARGRVATVDGHA